MKKQTMYVDCSTKRFMLNGKAYRLGRTTTKKIGKITHQDKILLEEIDVEREEAVLDEIARKIKKGVTVENVIREAIKNKLGSSEREKLLKLLSKKGARVEEQNGCYGIVVNGKHFQLFD